MPDLTPEQESEIGIERTKPKPKPETQDEPVFSPPPIPPDMPRRQVKPKPGK